MFKKKAISFDITYAALSKPYYLLNLSTAPVFLATAFWLVKNG
jgi:hypothetical protein